jgi:hypothetical protein
MPNYNNSPFAPLPQVALPGIPVFAFGSFNDRAAPTKMGISQVALTANVATLTVQLYEGNIPAVGSLITVQGTVSAGGAFNVVNVALTGVTINATSGAGTVTFALTHANVGATADSGFAIVPQPLVGETPTPPQLSVPVAFQTHVGSPPKMVRVEGFFSAAPGAFNVQIQESDTWNQQGSFITPSNANYTVTAVNSSNFFFVDLQPTGGQYMAVLLSSRTNSVAFTCKLTQLA